MGKVFCKECDWRGSEDQLLKAPNPFDETQGIIGCPKCKEPNAMSVACSDPECWSLATCGGPDDSGVYRWTCGKHATWLNRAAV